MTAILLAAMAGLGIIGGFLAGLLGFGGGVLMFPLLYYVPQLLGLPRLDAQTAAAVVVSQVFFSSLIGGAAHWRRGQVNRKLAVVAGSVSAIGSLAGGIASKWASERFLLLLFGIVTVAVLLMMFMPAPESSHADGARSSSLATVPLACCSAVIGVVIGFLGAGNFVFVPLLIYVFKVPTRAAIGSTLFIALINSTTGFLGKFVTAQIPTLAVPVIVGAAVGAIAGEKASHKLSTQTLRIVYAGMVFIITIRLWLTITGIAA